MTRSMQVSLAEHFSDDFKSAFTRNGYVVKEYIAMNAESFHSKYSTLIGEATWRNIFSAWWRIEKFLALHRHYMSKSFFQFYEYIPGDEMFWESLVT